MKYTIKEVISSVPENLKAKIESWLTLDQNDETREEVLALCAASNWDELHARFDQRILFGTAGLRARMEAGISRMNALVVLQATQGLASYIKSKFPENLSAVVGHDHRYHSREFAEITAGVFLEAGFKVYYLNNPGTMAHTPLVPFTVDHKNASVGVMITASHNPKMDNGYKVYYANGCQIIPPHDGAIAKSIEKNLEPWENSWNYKNLIKSGLNHKKFIHAKDEMFEKYVLEIQSNLVQKGSDKFLVNETKSPWFVYTPMHGVGFEFFEKSLMNSLGLKIDTDFLTVPEQIQPDPAFPTVSFPNPEEKGALNLAMDLAEKNEISLVLANDPDADRFSLAVKNNATKKWQQLTGNEIGFLFAYYMWQKYNEKDLTFKKEKPLAMLNSTVSSQMIRKMAEAEKFKFEDTLTGFKWIGNKGIQLESEGYYVPFGYEEAIGYMFSSMEHDKDGVSAAIIFLQAYREWLKKDKMSPLDIIEKGFKKYGYFKECNGYYTISDSKIISEIFSFIRNDYKAEGEIYPSKIGQELEVLTIRDLTKGYQSDTPDNVPNLPVDPTSEMITIIAKPVSGGKNDQVRFTMRGSGTEPKLKVYIEANSDTEESAQKLARLTWNVLKNEWFRPEETGLKTTF